MIGGVVLGTKKLGRNFTSFWGRACSGAYIGQNWLVLLSATEVLPVGLPCTRCDGAISSKGPGDGYWLGSLFPKPISHSRTYSGLG
jgi:hypothetical protein